jgi:23S rRNA (pseudouridine1915-N3)-methyltransferase
VKIKLITIGKTNINFISNGIEEYCKRLTKYLTFEFLELSDVRNSNKLSKNELKLKEKELLEKNIKTGEEIILLDENGKEFTSEQFSKYTENKMVMGNKNLTYIIGGAYGFHNDFLQKGYEKIALSKMTFSHQMIRLIFVEQLYRAFTIIKNEPYHH